MDVEVKTQEGGVARMSKMRDEGRKATVSHGQKAAPGLGHVVPSNSDAGAVFVLESKGNWKHAGFHLSTAIVAPALLSLPYALAKLGWAPGILALTIGAAVTFYAYMLLSQVLEHAELQGHRLLRFRDAAGYALGTKPPSNPCKNSIPGSIFRTCDENVSCA